MKMKAKKKRPKPFRAVTAVKSNAREVIGSPPPTQRQESGKRREKAAKHKPTLERLLGEEG